MKKVANNDGIVGRKLDRPIERWLAKAADSVKNIEVFVWPDSQVPYASFQIPRRTEACIAQM